MEDREIIDLYFDRNERAIKETETKYGRLCKKIAGRILGNAGDTEECLNDTYLGLWQAIPPKRPLSLGAFAAKIAHNIAIRRLQYNGAAKRNAEAILSLSELEEIIPDTNGFEEIEDREVGQWINEFLRGEKEEVRNIFLRKYWFFDSVAEISSAFGHSEAKIKSVLFHTRNRLRAYLTEKGVSL